MFGFDNNKLTLAKKQLEIYEEKEKSADQTRINESSETDHVEKDDYDESSLNGLTFNCPN